MNNRESAVWGSLTGDAFSLGAHWIYKTPQIQKILGRVEDYVDPISEYHPNRRQGQFTHYGDSIQELEEKGEASVDLAGRTFHIQRDMIDDLKTHQLLDQVEKLRKDLLVMHSPVDATVGIEHAAAIYSAAQHPKSFLSLDQADHLLTRADDAEDVADVISAWGTRLMEKTG